MDWGLLQTWFFGLGDRYGVDPLVYGSIYLGGIPFLYGSLGWLAYNARRGRPTLVPLLLAGLCFMSSYIYLIIAGRNVPWWAYAAIAVIATISVWLTVRQVKRRLHRARAQSAPGT